VVSHATNVVEHPKLVADRIPAYAMAAGRENVVAATDALKIAWAKLRALAESARLASATRYDKGRQITWSLSKARS
jgi:5-methyltetrahydropteroyltriglutamate--homocysteine methyltransferase